MKRFLMIVVFLFSFSGLYSSNPEKRIKKLPVPESKTLSAKKERVLVHFFDYYYRAQRRLAAEGDDSKHNGEQAVANYCAVYRREK